MKTPLGLLRCLIGVRGFLPEGEGSGVLSRSPPTLFAMDISDSCPAVLEKCAKSAAEPRESGGGSTKGEDSSVGVEACLDT